jgi:hypothetical protein
MTKRTKNRSEWPTYEAKAATIIQERRTEEVQLQKLKLRLQDKMQEIAAREQQLSAA